MSRLGPGDRAFILAPSDALGLKSLIGAACQIVSHEHPPQVLRGTLIPEPWHYIEVDGQRGFCVSHYLVKMPPDAESANRQRESIA